MMILPPSVALCVLVFAVLPRSTLAAGLGIPGTTRTHSGYDTEKGKDPICWRSKADTTGQSSIVFPNPLVEDFKLDGEVELLSSCPSNNTLVATAPVEFQRGERLRTLQWYDFHVNATLDLTSLGGNTFLADEGPLVAVQVVACVLGQAGFCSPFIHEESNARLAAQGITVPPARGDRHGGTHVHSPTVFVRLSPGDGPYYEFSVKVPLIVNDPGLFYAIAAVQMFVGDSSEETVSMRYDMANALTEDQRLVQYQAPAEVMHVEKGVRIFSYVAIGIVSAIILYLLEETVRHRKHQVLQLSQGSFLIIFLVAALVATVSSFLLQPRNDVYCQASYPIILISLQLFYSITIGRLWRINAVISPLLVQTLRQKQTWTTKLMGWLGRSTRCGRSEQSQRKSLRMQVSSTQLAGVVAIFAFPQVVIQVLALILQPRQMEIEFNENESKGRATCNSGSDLKHSLLMYGLLLFMLLIVVLLVIAKATQKLPSLFSETKVIFDSTLTTLVLLVLGLCVIIVTDDPTTTPAVEYLVWVALILSITLNTSVKIMLPKLRMVWRGETVLVSKLVSDHTRSVREKDSRHAASRVSVSGIAPPPTSSDKPTTQNMQSTNSNSLEVMENVEDFDAVMQDVGAEAQKHELPLPTDTQTQVDNGATSSSTGHHADRELADVPAPSGQSRHVGFNSRPGSKRALSSRIVISKEETPARRLVLKMVDLQQYLATVNERIMSGLAVSEEDWMAVRRLTGRLDSTFVDEVKFSWEDSQTGSGEIDSSEPGKEQFENEALCRRLLPSGTTVLEEEHGNVAALDSAMDLMEKQPASDDMLKGEGEEHRKVSSEGTSKPNDAMGSDGEGKSAGLFFV